MIERKQSFYVFTIAILFCLFSFNCFASTLGEKQIESNSKKVKTESVIEQKSKLDIFEGEISAINEELMNINSRIQTHEENTDCSQLKKDILSDYLFYSGFVVTSIALILAVFGLIVALLGIYGVVYIRKIVSNFNELGSVISIAFYRKSATDLNNRAVESFYKHDHIQAVSYSKTALKMLRKAENLEKIKLEKRKTLVLKDIIAFFNVPSEEEKQFRDVLFRTNLAFYYARIKERSMALDSIRWAKKGKDLGIKRNEISLIDTYLYVLLNYKDYVELQDIEEGKKIYQEYLQELNDDQRIPPSQKEKFSTFFGDGSYKHSDYQI